MKPVLRALRRAVLLVSFALPFPGGCVDKLVELEVFVHDEGGVPIDDVFGTLSATLGSAYINDFNKYGRTWQVLQAGLGAALS